MIPKIIHYIWIGDKPIPKLVEENNKVIGPDWEVKIWTDKDFTFKECKFVEEAYELGLYMYCSDALRFYVLKQYGGLYIDCDVKLYRTPDNLLELPYAIGNERYSEYSPNSGIMLSEPNNWLINICWEYYNSHHLIYDHHYKMEFDTDRLRKLFNDKNKIMVSSINEYKENVSNKICIFKYDGWETYNEYIDYSFAVHFHHCNWQDLNIEQGTLKDIRYTNEINNEININSDNLKIFLVAHKPISNYIPKNKKYVIIAQTKDVDNSYNDNFHDIIDISDDEFTKDHNICYGEGCAMRYLWKHPELLPDYVCFVHYRRYFFDFVYDEDKMISTIDYHGAIIKYKVNKCHLYSNNITGMYTDHFKDDISTFIDMVGNYAPKYFDTFFYEQLNSYDKYGYNCFAMKKEHFLEMCDMCFTVLDNFDKVMKYRNNEDVLQKMVRNNSEFFMSYNIKLMKFDLGWQRRLQGFLLEYLTELYYRYKFKIHNCYLSFSTPIK